LRVPLICLFSSLNNFLIPQPLAPLAVVGAQGPTSRSAPGVASETRLSPPESRGSSSPPTWASAALKCAPRDAWIGWSGPLQWQRLRLIANNSRFLLLPGVRVKNLASRILGLNLARLSEDWQRVHGHGLVLAETFIDPSRFAGSC